MIKYQQQWISKGYSVALTVDWQDFDKKMTISEYHQKHLAIIRAHVELKKKLTEKQWCVKRIKINKKKRRYWFLFKNDAHLITAIVHANIVLNK
jgi:hypothetical protein